MNQSTLNLVALAGMVGGNECAIRVLEGANNEVLGTSKGRLHLPRAWSAEDLEITKGWGFAWPENDSVYTRHNRSRELCVTVEVPAGWSVKPTDHYLYKDLLDPEGQKRATMMLHYQDHDAWLQVDHRKYRATYWSANYSDGAPVWPVIEDTNHKVLWVGEVVNPIPDYDKKHKAYWAEVRDRDLPHAAKITNEPKRHTELAQEVANKKLDELIADQSDPKWFEEPFEFPASEHSLPTVLNYSLCTTYYHSHSEGVADSGSSTIRAASPEEAIEMAKKTSKSSSYRIAASLTDPEGKKIWGQQAPPFQAPNHRRDSRGWCTSNMGIRHYDPDQNGYR